MKFGRFWQGRLNLCANLLILMPQRESGEAEPSPASAAAAAVPVFSDTAQVELAVRMGHGKRDGAAVRLVQGDYLVGLYERGEPMRPRQELPEAAYYDGPLGPGSDVNLLAVSYPWLSKRHPDPDRFHLNTLAPLLYVYARRLRMKLVVFVDFLCLFQGERTSAQAELFKQGLRAINVIYGQQHVKVWCLTRVPRHVDVDYFGRGWCTFELTIASVLKLGNDLLDMGKLKVAPSAVTDWDGQVDNVCGAGRRAPLTPSAFGAVLATKHFTNGKTDHELVVGLYADFVREALGGATALDFGALEWGDAEAMQVAEVLPLCTSLKSLDLGSNENISDAGVRALAERLPSGLEELDLSTNKITAAGAAALVARVPASLRALNMDQNRFRCPVANARTRAAVEQQVRFFQGEAAAVNPRSRRSRWPGRTPRRVKRWTR